MSATRTYDVPDISCDHCRATIESALSELEGVEIVEVDVPTRKVRVVGDISEEDVRDRLDEAGYEVAGVA